MGVLGSGAEAPREAPKKQGVYTTLREIGARSIPAYAAQLRLPGGETRLVVIERLARDASISDDQATSCVEEAEQARALVHPNLPRVRDVIVAKDEIFIANDFVDGEMLDNLVADAAVIPLAIGLRVVLDVLTGLAAIHGLRAASGQPAGLAHGEVAPSNVVVGADGVARLIRACRIRVPGPAEIDGAFIDPETRSGRGADTRADIHAVGVMLGNALASAGPEDAWGAPLLDIASYARGPADKRPTAATMAAEIRKVAGMKLATTARVATFVKASAGNKIAVRKAILDAGDSGKTEVAAAPSGPDVAPISFEAVSEEPVTAPRPPPAPAARPRPAPPVPIVAPVPSRPPPIQMPSRTATMRPMMPADERPPKPPVPAGPTSAIEISDAEIESVRGLPVSNPTPPPAQARPLAPPLGARPGSPALPPPTITFDQPEEPEPPTMRRPDGASAVPAVAPVPPPKKPALPPERPKPANGSGTSAAAAAIAMLPPVRAMQPTEPSIRVRRGRTRAVVASILILCVGIGGVAAWRVSQQRQDSSSSTAPTKATATQDPTATAAIATTTTTTEPAPSESTAALAPVESTPPAASSAPSEPSAVPKASASAPEPPPSKIAALPPSPSLAHTAPPAMTTTAAPTVTHTAAKPPPTATAVKPPPAKTFEPTSI